MIKIAAHRFFRWYCHPDFYPDISGDLEELYLRTSAQSPVKAEWKYLLQVVGLFRPSLLKPFFKNSIINSNGMLKNYFRISFRNLVKHKAYTFINVFGLATGLAAFLLIQQYVQFEKSYDRFHPDADQLYRLTTDQVVEGVVGTRDAMSFNPSGKALLDEVPEIEAYTTTYKFSELIFRKGEVLVTEEKVLGVDEHFLQLFGYKLLTGDAPSVLTEPNSLVLSQSKARYFFGDEDPVGQTIHLHSAFNRDFKVTGVIADPPENTHYKFDVLMSISTIRDILERDAWSGFNYYTYLKLDKNADIDNINELLPALSKKYIGKETSLQFHLQPVTDIHLHSDFTFEPEIHGNARTVGFLSLISVFILIIAWVNYINLSTARAIDRAKEVGIRKVVGARRKQLVVQFMFDALLINLLGALLAWTLSEVTLPYFNNLVSKEVLDHTWSSPSFLANIALFFAVGTLVSGIYPSLVLSGFSPVTVLKGKFRTSSKGTVLRKSLVIVQFTASLALIASTFVVYKQVNFMRSKDIGMSVDSVVGFRNPRFSNAEFEAGVQKRLQFVEDLKNHHTIKGAAMLSNLPGGGSSDVSSNSGGIRIVGKTERLESTTYIMQLDDEAAGVLGLQVLHGRNFSRQMATDTAAVIVNEAFLHRFGIAPSDSMINEKVQFGRKPENDQYPIIGIFKNANRSSLKNEVEPTVYFYNPTLNYTIVKLDAAHYKAGLDYIHQSWGSFFPDAPLKYTFLDERYENLYQEDKRFGAVFGTFSILALIVAMLGLFGLSSFMAIQRTKEVGIRKVLGASISHIVSIFYKDFLVLLSVALVLGIPLIYFSMNQWLSSYAYRISFPWAVPVLSFAMVLLIALLTVGYHVYKVAAMNPAKTLKYE